MLHFNSGRFLERGPESAMERRLLLGIDAPLSAATRHALHSVGTFYAPSAAHMHFLLLNVIPLPIVAGRYTPPLPLSPTTGQRRLAAKALRTACAILQQHGIMRSQIDTIIRIGTPADELVRTANQHHVDCLVVGSHGNSLGQWFRRVFMGSTSHAVLRFASCPVMLVTLPRSRPPVDLVPWYEAAIQRMLHGHPSLFVNVTAREVAERFSPPQVQTVGPREVSASAQALERLVCSKRLSQQEVDGEMHYLSV